MSYWRAYRCAETLASPGIVTSDSRPRISAGRLSTAATSSKTSDYPHRIQQVGKELGTVNTPFRSGAGTAMAPYAPASLTSLAI
jgi:hypothetical protein